MRQHLPCIVGLVLAVVTPACSCSGNAASNTDGAIPEAGVELGSSGDLTASAFDLTAFDLVGSSSCANGQPCPSGQQCVNGICTCPLYQTYCNGACIPISVDPNNCGGCGVQCTGAQACSGGKCSSSCLPGLTICSNTCVDLKNDNNHCGMCPIQCPPNQGCVDGTCVPAAALGPPPGMCTGGGPPIVINQPGSSVCAGNLAQTTFTWALCSCTDVTLSDLFITDAYDSTKGPYMPGGLGGGVGLNGNLNSSSTVAIGGALWSSAAGGVMTSSQTGIAQQLQVGGPLSAQMSVGDDAYVVGAINGSPITITKTLYHPGGAAGITGTVSYAAIVNQPVTVPPPCDACPARPAGAIPVAQIVAARQANNDNALIGLDPALLTRPNAPQRVDLPCGNYYLNAISNSGPLTIFVHGHTALYIGGDVSSSSSLAFTLDPTATFDIFIAGTISSSSALLIGSPNYPALTRTYVGGAQALTFSSNVSLSGNLYDANALVHWSSGVEAYGAVYAGNFLASSTVKIHYDRQVANAGQDCPPPPAPDGGVTDGAVPVGCGSCKDCNNQACINGTCGMCTNSTQCCPPLRCFNGTCALPIN